MLLGFLLQAVIDFPAEAEGDRGREALGLDHAVHLVVVCAVPPAAGAEDVGDTQADGTAFLQNVFLHGEVEPVVGIHLGLQVEPWCPVLATELDGPIVGQIHVGAELAAGLERRFVLVAQQGGALDGTLVEVHADVNFPPPEDLPIDNELHAVVVAFAEVEAGGGAVAVVERIVGFPPSIVIHIGGIPHEPVAGDHVVGLAVVERGEDVHLVDAEVVGKLESVGVLGVKVGVAEAYLVALADIHVGVEVPEMGAVYTAAVADLHTLHVGELVGEVQRRIELPIGLVDGFGGRVVEVFAVDGGVFGTQTGLQRKLFREVATQSAIDAVDMLAIVEMRRRGGVIDMRGGAGGAVVVSTLVGPVHATLVAGLQTPAVVEGAQPVELDIQRLVTVLRLAFAQIVVVIVGSGIAVDLLLLAVACHLAGAEGGVDGQLLILAVKLLCVEEVE